MTIKEAAASAKSRIVKHVDWEAPNGEVFAARVPTSLQLVVFFGAVSEDDGLATLNAVLKFLKNTFKDEGQYERIVELIEEGEIDLPDIIGEDETGETEGGRKSLIATLSEEVSGGRPTQSSDDSSTESSAQGGKRSTGRSPGKGSIRSTSRSTAS